MSDDIRAWARDNGIDIGGRGRIPNAVRERWKADHEDGGQEEGEEETVTLAPPAPPAVPSAVPDTTPAAGPRKPERPPQAPPRKRGLFGQRAAKDRANRKRVSIDNVVSSGWGLAAMALMRSPHAVPVARVLQYQAPVAGAIVDEKARGTVLDKALQPLARAGESGELVMALVGPPALVAAITAKPELYPALRPMLKMAMISWLRIAGPAAKKAARREAEMMEAIGEEELAGIDALIDSLWPDIPAGPPSPQEEEHIRRARGE